MLKRFGKSYVEKEMEMMVMWKNVLMKIDVWLSCCIIYSWIGVCFGLVIFMVVYFGGCRMFYIVLLSWMKLSMKKGNVF